MNIRITGLLLLAISLATPGTSSAALLPVSALESPVGRFLLGETATGLELMSTVLGRSASSADVDAFAATLRAANPDSLAKLEARLAQLRADLHEAQIQRSGGRDLAESDSFSADERAILREVADRELQTADVLRAPDPHPGEIDFVGGASPGAEPAPLASDPIVDLKEESLEKAPAEVQERAKRSFKEWYKDASECRMNRPSGASRSMDIRNTMEQMAITAGVTTVGTVAHGGFSRVFTGHFGVDLMTSLISTGVSMMWMSNRDSLEVRWLKVFSWGHLRSNLDAAIYRINPWTDTQGIPMDQAVAERKDFNYTWNAYTSWTNPLMFMIFNGEECLLEKEKGAAAAARFAKGAFVFKTGVSLGTSIAYQWWRGKNVRSESTQTH